jgi:hypothetical protein
MFYKLLCKILKFRYKKEKPHQKKVGLAERAGFEPAIPFPVYTLSRRAPSTTRTPLLRGYWKMGTKKSII